MVRDITKNESSWCEFNVLHIQSLHHFTLAMSLDIRAGQLILRQLAVVHGFEDEVHGGGVVEEDLGLAGRVLGRAGGVSRTRERVGDPI